MLNWIRQVFGYSDVPPPPANFPAQQDQIEFIQACRDRLGNAPRTLSGADLKACALSLTDEVKLLFAEKKDPLMKILADQALLQEGGEVVWGHLVQANSILFDASNPHTLPANVVYSMDHYFDGRVMHLGQIAKGLFAQKGTTPADRELREFVRVITDEKERILRRELPIGYCGGQSVFFTTCFIQPGHLPRNCLTSSSFPLLVNFKETEAVMLLPSHFWPYALVRQWTS
jgi:hypothetical protein